MISSLWFTFFCAAGYTAYASIDGAWSPTFGSTSGDNAVTVTSFDPYAFVTQVCGATSSDGEIDAIKAVFSDGAISQLYGNVEGGDYKCLDAVSSGQCITKVALHVYRCATCTKDRIQTLQFTASDGSVSDVLGNSKGQAYNSVSGGANRCLSMMKVWFEDVGVFSSGYDRLVGIQFYFASTPVPTVDSTSMPTSTTPTPTTTTTTSHTTASSSIILPSSTESTALTSQSLLETTPETTETIIRPPSTEPTVSTTLTSQSPLKTTADSELITTTRSPITTDELKTTMTTTIAEGTPHLESTPGVSTTVVVKGSNGEKDSSSHSDSLHSKTDHAIMWLVVSLSVVILVVVFIALYCHYFGGDCAGCFWRIQRNQHLHSSTKESECLIVEMESADSKAQKPTKGGDDDLYVLMDPEKN
mmetsp:Transcript_21933/g.35258  ORF Transcript_21933/g.35258 Transcript_21933/m.35258 type:complete len:416 (+) Transcript_21933:37-1284(+)